MSDFTRINEKRIDKIRELIQLINKSAGSQKPSAEEILMLCEPVYADLAEMGGDPPAAPDPGEAEVVSPPPGRPDHGPRDHLALVRTLTTRQQLDTIAVLATELEFKLWEQDQ